MENEILKEKGAYVSLHFVADFSILYRASEVNSSPSPNVCTAVWIFTYFILLPLWKKKSPSSSAH